MLSYGFMMLMQAWNGLNQGEDVAAATAVSVQVGDVVGPTTALLRQVTESAVRFLSFNCILDSFLNAIAWCMLETISGMLFRFLSTHVTYYFGNGHFPFFHIRVILLLTK